MNMNTFSATKATEEVLSLADKGILSAKVVLTGFVVVFSVLIMLIILISIYGAIVSKAENVAKNKKENAEKNVEVIQAPVYSSPSVAQISQTNGVPEEIVAVISAAVATMYGSTEKVRIKSIKKNNGRSAWANAGVLNNTRPF